MFLYTFFCTNHRDKIYTIIHLGVRILTNGQRTSTHQDCKLTATAYDDKNYK